jgi:GT2 family glycosyltransferase
MNAADVPRVAVIVPNWNGRHLLDECLDSLSNQTKEHTLVVVDNGSTDGSQAFVQLKYPQAVLIELDRNHGFAEGVNRGIQYSLHHDFDYVALFNNDAAAEKDWLKELVATAEAHPEVGIVAAKILYKDGRHIDSTGDFYTSWGLPYPRGRDEIDSGQYDDPDHRVIFGGTAGATLYRSVMMRRIGLFDGDFFAYFEDVDVSFRAQLAGWKVRYNPNARVRHEVNATSSRLGGFVRYHTIKNLPYLYVKNMPGSLFLKYLPKFLLCYALTLAGSLRQRQYAALFKGLLALRRLPVMVVRRRRIQRRRRASIAYIDSIIEKPMPPGQRSFPTLQKKFALRRRQIGDFHRRAIRRIRP